MSPAPVWRLLVDRPADGARNMAIDEALLESCLGDLPGDPWTAPTLRLYGWVPPALSLGRNQPVRGACDPRFLHRHGIDLVRRPTGGLAVLHEHERTFAVVGRMRWPPFEGGVVATYRAVQRALLRALQELGAAAEPAATEPEPTGKPRSPSCFATTSIHEIVVGRRKVVGSAQLRRRGAFLQHGSILLRCDAERVARALGSPGPGTVGELVGLETALGTPVAIARLDRAIVAAFENAFSTSLEPGSLSDAERTRVERLRAWRYLSSRWTRRR